MFERKKEQVWLSLGSEEADLLRKVVGEYLELFDEESPDDAGVMKRLFPPASLNDEKLDREFRELARDELTSHKLQTANLVLESLGKQGPCETTLDDEQREAWAVALNDLRLALGTRLGVDEDMMNLQVDAQDSAQFPLAVLHWLGALQESLVTTLM